MTSRSTHAMSVARMAFLAAILAFGLMTMSQAASADVLNPARDTGGPGGSGGVASVDYPVLDGSGYENAAVVAARDQETADSTQNESVLDGSGYENQTVANASDQEAAGSLLNEAARSTDLISMTAFAEASQQPIAQRPGVPF